MTMITNSHMLGFMLHLAPPISGADEKKKHYENMQELAFSAVMLHSSVIFISLAATLRQHIIKAELEAVFTTRRSASELPIPAR